MIKSLKLGLFLTLSLNLLGADNSMGTDTHKQELTTEELTTQESAPTEITPTYDIIEYYTTKIKKFINTHDLNVPKNAKTLCILCAKLFKIINPSELENKKIWEIITRLTNTLPKELISVIYNLALSTLPLELQIIITSQILENLEPLIIDTYDRCFRYYHNVNNAPHALACKDNLFFVAVGNDIECWNINDHRYDKFIGPYDKFIGQANSVLTLTYKDDLLFSGSNDGVIKIWNINTGKCIETFQGHTRAVRQLVCNDRFLFSCGDEKLIKIWDIKTQVCIHTLKGHKELILALACNDNLLFSGDIAGLIKIWDINTGKCINTIEAHEKAITALVCKDGLLLSGSLDRTIKIWGIHTGENININTLEGHEDRVNALTINNNMLFSGDIAGLIKIWNIKTGECLATLQGHQQSDSFSMMIYSLANNGNFLFSSSTNQSIRICDISHKNLFDNIEPRFIPIVVDICRQIQRNYPDDKKNRHYKQILLSSEQIKSLDEDNYCMSKLIEYTCTLRFAIRQHTDSFDKAAYYNF